ncbi:hypothetical protein BCR42DRAFT_415562 [Absidia repens]|uniref:Uncharacterized protein n=1 Tax=Absidia repens TaxID=90262 RepID=A0A1X2IFF0_9FUNG|nr:hypothetical protein BCR42DRAFT_415562 [Absidia repens]
MNIKNNSTYRRRSSSISINFWQPVAGLAMFNFMVLTAARKKGKKLRRTLVTVGYYHPSNSATLTKNKSGG